MKYKPRLSLCLRLKGLPIGKFSLTYEKGEVIILVYFYSIVNFGTIDKDKFERDWKEGLL